MADAKLLDLNKLDPHRMLFYCMLGASSVFEQVLGSKEYDTHRKVSDPITGGGSAIFWTVTHYYGGIAKIFYNPVQGIIDTTVAIPKGQSSITGI